MKKNLILTSLLASGFALGGLSNANAATVTWTGAANTTWPTAGNWDTGNVPTSVDDVIINNNTNITPNLFITANSEFNSLTVDPIWSGGDINFRSSAAFDIYDNITFTANHTTETTYPTFGARLAGNSTIRPGVSGAAFINNGSASVTFAGTSGNLVNFSTTNGANRLEFGGTGNFLMGDEVVLAGNNLLRLWTTETFSGTLTLNSSTRANFMDPDTDLRVQSGTIKIALDEQIGDTTNIAYGSVASSTMALDFQGVTEAFGILNNFADLTSTATMLVDGTTSLIAGNFNDGGSLRGNINIVGWVEGSSSIVFTALTAYDWTVADNEAFVGLTIDGSTAYMTDLGAGAWGVTAVPEPSTFALLAGMLALASVMIRRRA